MAVTIFFTGKTPPTPVSPCDQIILNPNQFQDVLQNLYLKIQFGIFLEMDLRRATELLKHCSTKNLQANCIHDNHDIQCVNRQSLSMPIIAAIYLLEVRHCMFGVLFSKNAKEVVEHLKKNLIKKTFTEPLKPSGDSFLSNLKV